MRQGGWSHCISCLEGQKTLFFIYQIYTLHLQMLFYTEIEILGECSCKMKIPRGTQLRSEFSPYDTFAKTWGLTPPWHIPFAGAKIIQVQAGFSHPWNACWHTLGRFPNVYLLGASASTSSSSASQLTGSWGVPLWSNRLLRESHSPQLSHLFHLNPNAPCQDNGIWYQQHC